jgi:hypothetical protein
MTFHCFACKNQFEATHFNLARITISCPVCETQLNITQSLTRVYGKIAGEQIGKIMDALQRVADRSRNSLMGPTIESAYMRISQLCEEAS